MLIHSPKTRFQYLRKLLVLPVALLAIGLTAFSFQNKKGIGSAEKPGTILHSSTVHSRNDVTEMKTAAFPPFTDTIKPGSQPLKQVQPAYPVKHPETVTIEKKSTLLSDKLIIVDGKKQSPAEAQIILQNMDPSVILSVSVYKDEKAREKYGDAAANGVIEINTKTGANNPDTTKKPLPKDNIIFERVETEPSYPGGMEGWKSFLQSNLNGDIPVKRKAPDGAYTVVIQFIVGKDGTVSDAKALTHHGYGMEEEALRVIAKMEKWEPAVQNGRKVSAYKKQPITFIVGKGEKGFRPVTATGSR